MQLRNCDTDTTDSAEVDKILHGQTKPVEIRQIVLTNRELGKYFPNSPMLAAIVKVSSVMDDEAFLAEMQKSYAHKFASKPEVIEGNMKALSLALQEVL